MRFRVPVKAFHPAYAAALAAASKNSPQPIMKNVLCRATGDGTVTLEGADGSRGVIARVAGVEVQEEGTAVLDGVKVDGVLRANADHTLYVNAKLTELVVGAEWETGGRQHVSRHSLPPYPADQFPSIAGNIAGSVTAATSPVAELLTLFRRVKFAASDDMADEKHKSRGVMVQAADGRVSVAGIQPNLSVAAIASCAAEVRVSGALMVPANALSLLAGVLPKGDGMAELRLSAAGLAVVTRDCDAWLTAMISPLPTGGKLFPPADQEPIAAWSDALPLLHAVEQAAVTTSADSVRGFFTFTQSGGVVTTSAPGVGESEVPFDLPGFAGQEVRVPFNTQAVRKIHSGLKKEETVSAEVYKMGNYLRLLVKYGTPESGGKAVLVQMTVAD